MRMMNSSSGNGTAGGTEGWEASDAASLGGRVIIVNEKRKLILSAPQIFKLFSRIKGNSVRH
jgi:hypothetical protein